MWFSAIAGGLPARRQTWQDCFLLAEKLPEYEFVNEFVFVDLAGRLKPGLKAARLASSWKSWLFIEFRADARLCSASLRSCSIPGILWNMVI